MARVDDNWQDYYINDVYTSFSSLAAQVKNSPYPNSRCGKVRRAPTLSEYEQDDTYYYGDDTHFEDRR